MITPTSAFPLPLTPDMFEDTGMDTERPNGTTGQGHAVGRMYSGGSKAVLAKAKDVSDNPAGEPPTRNGNLPFALRAAVADVKGIQGNQGGVGSNKPGSRARIFNQSEEQHEYFQDGCQ